MMEQKVYQQIAHRLDAYQNSLNNDCLDRILEHEDYLDRILDEYLPNGSGFDNGVFILLEKSSRDKIVLQSSYHLMNSSGFYEGWIDFEVIIRPSLSFGCYVDIKGPFSKLKLEYAGLKEYIQDTFDYHLRKRREKI